MTNKAARRFYLPISLVGFFHVLAAFVYGEDRMPAAVNGWKLCPKCEKTKKVDEFGVDNTHKDGMDCWCRDCRRKQCRERQQKNKERNLKEGITITEKRCSRCGKTKSVEEFGSCITNKDGLSCPCNDCRRKQSQNRKGQRQQYCQDNKEEIKQYRQNHKKERNTRRRLRRQVDTMYKLNTCISTAIRDSLRNGKNGHHWEDLVDYTAQQLKTHLTSLFKPGMTWDNHGNGPSKWNIDHIRPISSFSFTPYDDPEFKQCWALSNLQPLWWEENMRKGANWID